MSFKDLLPHLAAGMANKLEAPQRLDDAKHPVSRDREAKSSLLQHHLSLYNDLIKVQPQRHTEQQLKMEREQKKIQVFHEEQTELERIRQKYQIEGTSKGGKSYLFDTDFETQRHEMIVKQRAKEKRRNEEEAYVIQDEMRNERKDKVVKPKWYEVEHRKKMVDVKASEQVLKQGRKLQSYNIWDKRKEDHERHHKEMEEMLPKNEADEEEMFRRAIELSRQTAEQSRNILSKLDQRSGQETSLNQIRTYKSKGQIDSIWDIDSDEENEMKKTRKYHQQSCHVGYAMAVKKKRMNETGVSSIIGKRRQKAQLGCDSVAGNLTRVGTMRARGRGSLLLKDSVEYLSLDSKGDGGNSVCITCTSCESSLGSTYKGVDPKGASTNTSNPRFNSGVENDIYVKADQNNNNFTTTNLQTDSYCTGGEDWNKECSDWYLYCGPQFDSGSSGGGVDNLKSGESVDNKQMINDPHPKLYKEIKDSGIPSVQSSNSSTNSSDSSSSETDSDFHFPSVSFVASKKGAEDKQTTENHPLLSVLQKEVPANYDEYSEVYVPLITSVNIKSGKKTVTFAKDEIKLLDDVYVPLITNVDGNLSKKTVTFADREIKSFDGCKSKNGGISFTEKENGKNTVFNFNDKSSDHSKVEERNGGSKTPAKKNDTKISDGAESVGVNKELISCKKQIKSKQDKDIVKASEILETKSESEEKEKCFKAVDDAKDVGHKTVPKVFVQSKSKENAMSKCVQEQTLGEIYDSSQQDKIPEGLPEHLHQSYFNYIHKSQDNSCQTENASSKSLSGYQNSSGETLEQPDAFIHPFMNPFILANYYTPETLQMMMAQAQELMKHCQIGFSSEQTVSEEHNGEVRQVDEVKLDPCIDNCQNRNSLQKIRNHAEPDPAKSMHDKVCSRSEHESAHNENKQTDTPSEDSLVLFINLKGSLGVCERKLRMPKFPAVATRLSRKNLLSLNIDPSVQSPTKEPNQEVRNKTNDARAIVTVSQNSPHCQLQKGGSKSDIKVLSNRQKIHGTEKGLTDEQCGWVETGNITHSFGSQKGDQYYSLGACTGLYEYAKSGTLKGNTFDVDRSKCLQESNITNISSQRSNMLRQFTDRKESLSSENRNNSVVDSKRGVLQGDFKSTLDHNRMIRDAIKEIRKQAKLHENEVTESGDAVKKLRYF